MPPQTLIVLHFFSDHIQIWKPKNSNLKHAYIIFYDPLDAARLLKSKVVPNTTLTVAAPLSSSFYKYCVVPGGEVDRHHMELDSHSEDDRTRADMDHPTVPLTGAASPAQPHLSEADAEILAETLSITQQLTSDLNSIRTRLRTAESTKIYLTPTLAANEATLAELERLVAAEEKADAEADERLERVHRMRVEMQTKAEAVTVEEIPGFWRMIMGLEAATRREVKEI